MKISDLEFYTARTSETAGGRTGRPVVLRLRSDAGPDGWGEAWLAWRTAELPDRRDHLLPLLAGHNAFDLEELAEIDVLYEPALRAAVEMACWDLIGRAVKLPVHRLWGGCYRARLPLAVRLPNVSGERAAQVAREMAERGFHTQVLSSRGDPAWDAELVRAVRESAGPHVELRFDGCAQYGMEDARELCARLEPYRLECLVDPIREEGFDGLASLRRQVAVPLAVQRSVHGSADVLAVARHGVAHAVIVDPARVGGVTSARKCAAVAEAAGLRAAMACSGRGVALAAAVQLAAATPALVCCHECESPNRADDVLCEPLLPAGGMLAVPQGPGLGVEVNRYRLDRSGG